MDSIRNLRTCLRDQKKRCKRLYAEAKEAIVVAQERLTEAVDAYTDLLQHIEGKPYLKDAKLEEDDDKDDDDSRSTWWRASGGFLVQLMRIVMNYMDLLPPFIRSYLHDV